MWLWLILSLALSPSFGAEKKGPFQWLYDATLERLSYGAQRRFSDEYLKFQVEKLRDISEERPVAFPRDAIRICEYFLHNFPPAHFVGEPERHNDPKFWSEMYREVITFKHNYVLPRKPLKTALRFTSLPAREQKEALRVFFENSILSLKVIARANVMEDVRDLKVLALTEVVLDLLGVDIEAVEQAVKKNSRIYKGELSAMMTGLELNTPIELLMVIKRWFPERPIHVIDIGSGYGLPGVVWGITHPKLKYTGFDLVREKVRVANRLSDRLDLTTVKSVVQDLDDPAFELPAADFYFVGNSVKSGLLDELLDQIHSIGRERSSYLIMTGLNLPEKWRSKFREHFKDESYFQLGIYSAI